MKKQWVTIEDAEIAMSRASAAYEEALRHSTSALIAADFLVAGLEGKRGPANLKFSIENYKRLRKLT